MRGRRYTPPTLAFDREWIQRMEIAVRLGPLEPADAADLVDAVRALRFELDGLKWALERLQLDDGPSDRAPDENVAAWVEDRIFCAVRAVHTLFSSDRLAATRAATELRLMNWPLLGLLGPAVRKLRWLEANQGDPLAMDLEALAPPPMPRGMR